MPYEGGLTQLGPMAVAVPILAACLLLALARRMPRMVVDGVTTVAALAVVGMDAALFASTGDGRVVTWLGHWTPVHGHSVGVVFVVDRLGSGIALLSAGLMVAALVFSWRYLESADGHFQAMMLLFLAGMTGFALTGDLFDMFVFFELMGAVAYALTGFKIEDPTSVQGALNFGIVNSFGAYLTLTGVALLYAHTGQLGLAQLGQALHGQPPKALIVVAFVLVLTGWFVKAAVVPFHFWLDDAHAVAPTPVCVIFSGVMVELGLYGVYRVYWTAFDGVIPSDDVRRAFLVLGVVTAIVGAVMTLMQRHLKRLLAFSTIAHVGLFTCAAATMDAPGTTGAALYVVGHAGAKSALFLLAGALLNRYDSVDELHLHGRGRDARVTGVLFGIAGLALCGLPPFGTGLGKAIGEDALSKAGYWFGPVLFVAISALTGGAVLRAGARIFLGLGRPPAETAGPAQARAQTSGDEEEKETDRELTRVPWSMASPAAALIVVSLLVGVVPGVARSLGQGAVGFLDHSGYLAQTLHRAAAHPVAPPEGISWTVTGVGLGLLATLLALGVAATALYGRQLAERLERPLRLVAAPLSGLRQLHSGHVGDYISWLLVGVGALAALIGLPLR